MRDRAVKTSPLTPAYQWDARSQRYVNAVSKKFVSRDTVRQALDIALGRSQTEVTRLSRALVNGQINLATWQTGLAAEIKSMHLASAALAKGGWAQMTQSDFGSVGRRVRDEYAFLAKFAEQVKRGEQKLDGSLVSRATLYAQGPRGTFHAVQERAMSDAGYTECRNVLQSGDNCEGCIAETAKGWTFVGNIKPVGSRTCLGNCRCTLQFRKASITL